MWFVLSWLGVGGIHVGGNKHVVLRCEYVVNVLRAIYKNNPQRAEKKEDSVSKS